MSNYDIAYIFKAIDQFSAPLKNVNAAMSRFEKQIDKTQGKFNKFNETVSKAGKFLFTRFALPMIGLAGYAFKNAEQFKMAEIRLRAFTKTAADASKLMAFARSESMRSGFGVEKLLAPAQILSSRGLSTDEIKKRVSQLTTLSLGTGKEFSELGERYANWVSRGFASGRELRSMPIMLNKLRDMATKKGWSEAMFRKAIAGKIGIDSLNRAIDQLTEKNSNLSKSAEEARGTMENSWNRMHETFRLMSADIGDSLISVFHLDNHLKNIADYLAEAEPKLKAWLAANPDLVKMGTYLGGIFIAISGIAASIKTVVWGFGLLANSFKVIAEASGPILAVLAMFKGAEGVDFASFNQSMLTALKQFGGGETMAGWKTVGGALSALGESAGTAQAPKIKGAAESLGFTPLATHKVDVSTSAPSTIKLLHSNGQPAGTIQLQTKASLGTYPIATGGS